MAILNYEKQDHIVTITLNRPERFNSINYDLTYELAKAFIQFESDDDAWVAILIGAGKAFCAGQDLNEGVVNGKLKDRLNPLPVKDPYWEDFFQKPVIAAVNGVTLGAGFLLALRADLRVASEKASFQLTEVTFGFPIGVYPEEHWILRENLPYAVTAELLSGMKMSAARAYEVGFVNYVVPPEEVLPKALALAKSLISAPPLTVRCNLKFLRDFRRLNAKLPSPLSEQAPAAYAEQLSTHDCAEALAAYLEKRRPVFRGE